MNTQIKIHDSLFCQPIKKAALYACLRLTNDASNVRGAWGEAQIQRAARIADRFKIRDLVLQWRNAAPVK